MRRIAARASSWNDAYREGRLHADAGEAERASADGLASIVRGEEEIVAVSFAQQQRTGQMNGIERANRRRHWLGSTGEHAAREADAAERSLDARELRLRVGHAHIIQCGSEA